MLFRKNTDFQDFSNLLNKMGDEIMGKLSDQDKKRWYDIYNSMYEITEKEFAAVKKNCDVLGGLQTAWRNFKIGGAEKSNLFKELEDLKNHIDELLLGFDRGTEGYGNEKLQEICKKINDEVGKCNRVQRSLDADMHAANEQIREKESQLMEVVDSDDEILIEDLNADLNDLEDSKAEYQNQINQVKIKKNNLLKLYNWIRRIIQQKSKERLDTIAKKIAEYDLSDPQQVLKVVDILKDNDAPVDRTASSGSAITRQSGKASEIKKPSDPRSAARLKKLREMKELERSSVSSTFDSYSDPRENNKNN